MKSTFQIHVLLGGKTIRAEGQICSTFFFFISIADFSLQHDSSYNRKARFKPYVKKYFFVSCCNNIWGVKSILCYLILCKAVS